MKSNRRIAAYGLLLWAQLVFGLGMTLWRDSLVLFSDWEPNAVNVPPQLDAWVEQAVRMIPPNETVGLLMPGNDEYTAEYARLAVLLYPRRVWWLGNGAVTSPINRWMPIDLHNSDWVAVFRERGIRHMFIFDLADIVPCPDHCLQFDATHYLWKDQ